MTRAMLSETRHPTQASDTSPSRGLEQAFGVFNQVSEQLTAAYHALEQRTERLNAELAAARSERLQQLAEKERLANRLEALLNALPAAVVVLNGAGRVAECNPAAREFLGEPLIGQCWTEIFARAFVPRLAEHQELCLRDGRRMHMSQSTLGAEPGRILLFKDVTETRALQERLNHHQRLSAMGEMTAALAHQIRTPLAAALLYCAQLVNPNHSVPQVARYAGKIQSRLHHLETLTNDMLLFARGSGGGEVETVPVADLLHDFQQALEAHTSAGLCTLSIADETRNVILHGHRQALLSALQNLAVNAMQACGTGARLSLSARSTLDAEGYPQVLLALTDNGPGVAAELRERIFEPFFTTRTAGTGLGLAVVQSIAHAHHGSVWVEPAAGAGSTFTLSLPVIFTPEILSSGNDTVITNVHPHQRLSSKGAERSTS